MAELCDISSTMGLLFLTRSPQRIFLRLARVNHPKNPSSSLIGAGWGGIQTNASGGRFQARKQRFPFRQAAVSRTLASAQPNHSATVLLYRRVACLVRASLVRQLVLTKYEVALCSGHQIASIPIRLWHLAMSLSTVQLQQMERSSRSFSTRKNHH